MKKMLKVLGFILLALVAAAAVFLVVLAMIPAAPRRYWEDIDTDAAIESKYNALGSYTVATRKYDAPQDDSDKDSNFYQVWYPEEEGTYPLVVMVNGSGIPCNKYEAVFEHFASWGYVVIGNNYGTNWDGQHASETLDFALSTEEIAQMVDPSRIAIGGHSQGGMGTFSAITEHDNGSRYSVAFSISPTYAELALGLHWSFGQGEDQYAFRLEEIEIPMLLLAGTGKADSQTISPLVAMEREYSQLAGDKAMFRRADDVDHGQMLYESNGYVIAWLDYYLKGVEENESAFYTDDAELSSNPRYQDFRSNRQSD